MAVSDSPDNPLVERMIDEGIATLRDEGRRPIVHTDSKNVASRFCGGGDAVVSCNRDRVAAS